jgi:hypothetical protein
MTRDETLAAGQALDIVCPRGRAAELHEIGGDGVSQLPKSGPIVTHPEPPAKSAWSPT